MQLIRKHSSTSNILRVTLRNSSTGQGLTGLDENSSGLIISTICDNEASATAYAVASSKVETISTIGTYAAPTSTKCRFKAVDATNHRGLYELHFADARFSVSGAKVLRVNISGAANLLDKEILIQLEQVPADLTHILGSGANITRFNDFLSNAIDASGYVYPRGITDGNSEQVLYTDVGLTINSEAGLRAALGLGSANLDTQLTTIDDFLDTEIAAIKAKTDNLPSDPADASDIAGAFSTVNTTLSTIASYIDTEVAAIKLKTDNLPASPAAVGSAMTLTSAYDPAKTAAQAGDAMTLTSGERSTLADSVWDEATSGHQTTGTTGKALTSAGAGGGGTTNVTITGADVEISD